MAKGIIYSITTFIIGALILTLSIIIFANSQNTELRAMEINLLNTVYDLQSSLSESIAKLFTNTAGIKINVENHTVTISETIPNRQFKQYKNNITEFKDFIENDNRLVKIDNTKINNLPLKIMPYKISYERESLDSKKVQIKNNDSKNYYESISITFNITGMLGVIIPDEINSGIIPLVIIIQNLTNKITQTINIDISKENEIETENGGAIFNIDIEDGEIEIENEGENEVQVIIKLDLQDISKVSVVYPSNILIQFPEFEVYSEKNTKIV